MGSESTIAVQIKTALAQHLKRDVSKIRPTDRLREDLGLDSLAMIELLFKIEEHFDLEIPNEDLSKIATVADVTAYVEGKLAGGPVAASAPAAVADAAAAVAAPAAPAVRAPAKVAPLKAAAKPQTAKAPVKTAAKKKGSRPA